MDYCGIQVNNPFFLAPMAGVTDAPFRALCEENGASLTYTEMVSAKALVYHDKKTADLLRLDADRRPCIAQIFGHEPDVMAEAARLALEISGAEGIDINMGCPVSKVVGNGDGSALMRDPAQAAAIVTAVKKAVPVPVTVKFRKGFEANSDTCASFARVLEDAGADGLCVHGRTRAQMYSGQSDRRAAAEVKAAVRVPVVASGDLFTPRQCLDTMTETGVDFVMIARGAQGNPFIFDDCLRAQAGETIVRRRPEDVVDAILRQAEALCAQKGEARAMIEFRKHGLWYMARFSGVKTLKVRMSGVTRLTELQAICRELTQYRLKEVTRDE